MIAAIARTDEAVAALLEAAPSPLDLLRATAERRPDHPAFLFVRDASDVEPQSLSYADVIEAVERAATGFLDLGMEKGDSAALLLPTVPDAAIALIAATAAGTTFPMNPLLSAEAIRSQLHLARAKVVVTIGDHPAFDVRSRVGAAIEGTGTALVEIGIGSPTGQAMRWDDLVGREPRPIPPADPDRVAALFHTGGTTGDPKLAQLTARNFAAGALMAASGTGWSEDDRIVCALPLFHVGGAIDVMLSGLAAGATIVFPGVFGMRDPDVAAGIWSIVERVGATVLGAVPTSLAAIRNVPLGDANIGRLRRLATGGSPLAASVDARIRALTGRPVRQLYGMTETAGIIAAQTDDSADEGLNVGRPVPLMKVAVGEPGAACQPGMRGELFVTGPNVFGGYRTGGGIVGAPEQGWIATGDIAEVLPGGALRIAGRAKDVIIRGGHNIDPVAIEDAAAAHPDVVQAGAVGMPDAYAGELPVLFVALRPGAAADEAEIAAFVAERIVEPPARPKRVTVMNELPLTPFGKVARYRLRQRAAEERASEALADVLGIAAVECSDPAARRLRICLEADAPADSAQRAADRLAELGLEAESS